MSDMKGTPCISGGYTNTMTDEDSDLIRRSEAITAIQKAYADTEGGEDKCAVWKNVGLTNALHIMQDLPSAQPKRTEKRTETHACDLISRQVVINTVRTIILGFFSDEDGVMTDTEKTLLRVNKAICNGVRALPSAQPVDKDIDVPSTDTISRQAVRYKLVALVNEFEEILSHIREREVNDSVCGLCEYDGAYIGQSGDWCNECPGFEKDDCFKLKEKYRKEWMDING